MPKTNEIVNFPAPERLSDRSRRIWGRIVPKNRRSTGRVTILEEALRALDKVDQVREILERDGMVTKTEKTGAIHLHPHFQKTVGRVGQICYTFH